VRRVNIRPQDREQATHNLYIDGANNFFAGASRILVHNTRVPLDTPGYRNYTLRDSNGDPYYHGMFGPNDTQLGVERRHGNNGNRFDSANGDVMEIEEGSRTYGEARRLEHEGCVQDGTHIGRDGSNYRGNRQYPLNDDKFSTYYREDAC